MLNKFQGDVFLGEKVTVSPYSSDQKPPPEDKNLYVKNLPLEMTSEELRRLFSPHGRLGSVKVAEDGAGNSRGFGFVSFASGEEAQQAQAKVHGLELEGKPLVVVPLQRKCERIAAARKALAKVNLYVRGFGASSDEDLPSFF